MTTPQPSREERNADMPGTGKVHSMGDILKNRPPFVRAAEEPQQVQRPAPQPPKSSGKFVITCWDGDIYILEGYVDVDDILNRIQGLDWVKMPNGSRIKASAISKVQSYEDYRFQHDASWRHKRGQHLRLGGERPTWNDPQHGEIIGADVKAITGQMKNSPALPQSTEKTIALQEPKP